MKIFKENAVWCLCACIRVYCFEYSSLKRQNTDFGYDTNVKAEHMVGWESLSTAFLLMVNVPCM